MTRPFQVRGPHWPTATFANKLAALTHTANRPGAKVYAYDPQGGGYSVPIVRVDRPSKWA